MHIKIDLSDVTPSEANAYAEYIGMTRKTGLGAEWDDSTHEFDEYAVVRYYGDFEFLVAIPQNIQLGDYRLRMNEAMETLIFFSADDLLVQETATQMLLHAIKDAPKQ